VSGIRAFQKDPDVRHLTKASRNSIAKPMRQYIGLIRREADSDFGVSFPDLPGVATAGASLDDARIMAEEALAFHIDGLVADGAASEAVQPRGGYERSQQQGWSSRLSRRENRSAQSARVNVALPEDVLEQINRHAAAHGFTGCGFIARAVKKAVE